MSTKSSSLRIGLHDNSCHSLQRGYELWQQGNATRDGWLLKEAVFWIHHGIELVLKQLLVQSNEYLVFEKVDDAVKKLAQLRRQANMSNARVLDLFDQNEGGIVAVSFHNLIQRAALMINIAELSEGMPLRSNIDELTRFRNKIVHFSIEMDVNHIASLLSDILDPLLDLLSREIHDTNFINNCIPDIRRRAQPVRDQSVAYEQETIHRLLRLIRGFNGQRVKGELFGLDGEFLLPVFSVEESLSLMDKGADIKAFSPEETWLVEVKTRFAPAFRDRILERLEQTVRLHPAARGG
jgi:hypothetical protein